MYTKKIILLALFFIFSNQAFSQVSFSGDARFRPRYDITDKTGDGKTQTENMYYQIRARLRMKADIGDNWLFKAMLSANDYGNYSKSSDSGLAKASGTTSANESGGRPGLSFMELYMGHQGEDWGFKVGLLLMGGFSNPIFDIHFYPAKMIDIPYFIYNNDGHYGFSGYYKLGPGKLNAAFLVDDNKGALSEDIDGNEVSNTNDNLTLYLKYKMPVTDEISISPELLAPIVADDSSAAPITVGANVSLPALSGLKPSLFFGYTQQGEEDFDPAGDKIPGMPNNKYTAWLVRGKIVGKIGPGSIYFWMDYGSRVDELASDIKYNFYYHWLNYTFTLHKGEYGSFSVSPEWRMIHKMREDKTIETRHKIEFRFDIKFK
jgi:hypothetical protein